MAIECIRGFCTTESVAFRHLAQNWLTQPNDKHQNCIRNARTHNGIYVYIESLRSIWIVCISSWQWSDNNIVDRDGVKQEKKKDQKLRRRCLCNWQRHSQRTYAHFTPNQFQWQRTTEHNETTGIVKWRLIELKKKENKRKRVKMRRIVEKQRQSDSVRWDYDRETEDKQRAREKWWRAISSETKWINENNNDEKSNWNLPHATQNKTRLSLLLLLFIMMMMMVMIMNWRQALNIKQWKTRVMPTDLMWAKHVLNDRLKRETKFCSLATGGVCPKWK